jgi:hypothetical protein
MVEAIQLGVGLATGVSKVWDRWGRGRPRAWVTAKRFLGGTPFKYIRIQNPGPADVLVLGVRAYPRIYGISRDHSLDAIIKVQVNIDVNILLGQGKTWDLPIGELPKPVQAPKDESNAAEGPKDQPVRFFIYWRKTSSSWLKRVPVVIPTSTDDIERIAAAATETFR